MTELIETFVGALGEALGQIFLIIILVLIGIIAIYAITAIINIICLIVIIVKKKKKLPFKGALITLIISGSIQILLSLILLISQIFS